MDIEKERKAFDQYFKEKYPELYKDVFDPDGDERAIIGYSFAWSAWQAKAQAVPEGFVLVEKKLIKTLHEELLDHEPDSFVVNRDICELWKQAMLEAQEQSHDS